MDIRSHLTSLNINELMEIRKWLDEELRKRRKPMKDLKKVITYTDGASRGNPGPAGVGALIFDENNQKLFEGCEFIGETTNNVAEYRALILVLNKATEYTSQEVQCYMDSELLVRQLNGDYSLKSEKLSQLFQDVSQLVENFKMITFTHVRREHPQLKLADKLANKAIDQIQKNNSPLKEE